MLMNGHEKLEDLEKQRDVEGYIAKVPELLGHGERPSQVFEGADVKEAYAEFVALSEMGYHATGAVLLAGADRHFPSASTLRWQNRWLISGSPESK